MIKIIGNTLFFYKKSRFRNGPNKGLLEWGKFWMFVMDGRHKIGKQKTMSIFFLKRVSFYTVELTVR